MAFITKIVNNGCEYTIPYREKTCKYCVDAILVGGGGGGGVYEISSRYASGGGGGGNVLVCNGLEMTNYALISIGSGGCCASCNTEDNCRWTGGSGGDTCFVRHGEIIVSKGGCGGSGGAGGNSGSGCAAGGGILIDKYNTVWAGGGGGAAGNGISGNCGSGQPGHGGLGLCGFGGGGGGGSNGCGCCGGGNAQSNATNYGGGGGSDRNGYQGLAIICYKTDGSCGFTCATGGNSCKTCNGYKIHCFTSCGTFTIVS